MRMKYTPPSWLPGGHAQTIWPLAIKEPMPPLQRRRWETPDGDFIDLDRLPERPGQPLLILFHGLEGSSRSHYARSLMNAAHAREWNGVVVHFRGCSGEPNRLPRAYHSGDADEIDWILRKLAARYPNVPRYAAGVSLGGNALLCWLGTRKEAAHRFLTRAAAVSAPLDLSASGHALGRGFNRVYTEYFLRTMRRTAALKAAQHPGRFDASRATKARSLHEFDDAYTAPLHGFRDVRDYWARASSKPLLGHIAVPTLVLNARNDPFLPRHALPKKQDVSPMVSLEQPEYGGHVGFVTGGFPGRLGWLPERLFSYFRADGNETTQALISRL